MVYLIIQINKAQPSTMPFENVEKMRQYVREKLGDKTVAAIHDNVYFVHVKENDHQEDFDRMREKGDLL